MSQSNFPDGVVYNVTIKIDTEIESEWLEWITEDHIPEVIATGLFDEYKLFRLLEQDDDEGLTYIIQYFTSSIERYKKYINEFSPMLRSKTFDKWGNRFIAFRSVMQIVN